MDSIISIVTLFIFLGAGFVAARIRVIRNNPVTDRLSAVVLYALLFFMGFRIASGTGSDSLLEIGSVSLVFALSVSIGTALILFLIYLIVSVFSLKKKAVPSGTGTAERKPPADARDSYGAMDSVREPLKLLIVVIAGFAAGCLVHIPGFTAEAVSGWMLRFLLFSIGIDMVKSRVSLKDALAKPETLYLPLGVILGSLIGGIVPGLIFDIDFGKSLAVASGFGWYSLSGVLITDLGDPVLGSAAFVSNILRETIALLTIPLLSRTRFPHIGIGVAGATSMDVTLPLIERSCGPDSVPLSITSGAVLSLLVPVLVPLFYQI